MTTLEKIKLSLEAKRLQQIYTKQQLLELMDLLLIPIEEENMKDWNKALEEAVKKRFNEGVEKVYTSVSHGKIHAPEKEVKVVDLTDPIIEKLKAKFDERSIVGIKKYGTTLDQNNTDDFLNHLLEELMDASAYIMKLIDQREKK